MELVFWEGKGGLALLCRVIIGEYEEGRVNGTLARLEVLMELGFGNP